MQDVEPERPEEFLAERLESSPDLPVADLETRRRRQRLERYTRLGPRLRARPPRIVLSSWKRAGTDDVSRLVAGVADGSSGLSHGFTRVGLLHG